MPTALRKSALYRDDVRSYLLYPDRQLPRFTEQNVIGPERVKRSALLSALVARGSRDVIVRDGGNGFHFNENFRSAKDVRAALDVLSESELIPDAERAYVLALFEETFDHRSYTGRSDTFFGYEGLGCVYWHMVSKLLRTAKEACFRAEDDDLRRRHVERYRDIRAGLGHGKTPAEYGAFPTGPYSHTPGHGRAQQPGMTGQVKRGHYCPLG